MRKSYHTACIHMILASVCPHMCYKVSILWESLVTLVAFIWFLPSVCPHMSYKIIIFLRKLFHIGCIDMDFPQCESYYGLQECYFLRKSYRTSCTGMFSPQCVPSYRLQDCYFWFEKALLITYMLRCTIAMVNWCINMHRTCSILYFSWICSHVYTDYYLECE